LSEPFTFDGYEFSSYNADWWHSNGWVASREVEAENAGIAKNEFIRAGLSLT
jgi:hypothetical protein